MYLISDDGDIILYVFGFTDNGYVVVAGKLFDENDNCNYYGNYTINTENKTIRLTGDVSSTINYSIENEILSMSLNGEDFFAIDN